MGLFSSYCMRGVEQRRSWNTDHHHSPVTSLIRTLFVQLPPPSPPSPRSWSQWRRGTPSSSSARSSPARPRPVSGWWLSFEMVFAGFHTFNQHWPTFVSADGGSVGAAWCRSWGCSASRRWGGTRPAATPARPTMGSLSPQSPRRSPSLCSVSH